MGGERVTEIGGLRAVWRSTHDPRGRIEVSAVHDTHAHPERTLEFAPGTDLALARAAYPKWDRLWDSVQHEFWADVAASAGCSSATAARTEATGKESDR